MWTSERAVQTRDRKYHGKTTSDVSEGRRCLGMGNTGKGRRKAVRGKYAQDHLNLEGKD